MGMDRMHPRAPLNFSRTDPNAPSGGSAKARTWYVLVGRPIHRVSYLILLCCFLRTRTISYNFIILISRLNHSWESRRQPLVVGSTPISCTQLIDVSCALVTQWSEWGSYAVVSQVNFLCFLRVLCCGFSSQFFVFFFLLRLIFRLETLPPVKKWTDILLFWWLMEMCDFLSWICFSFFSEIDF